jgi:repressor LexA
VPLFPQRPIPSAAFPASPANQILGALPKESAMPSEKQLEIYEFVRGHSARTGRPPTLEEIRRAQGLSTKSLVAYHLKALESAGLIERTPQVSRGIRPIEPAPSATFRLPIKGWIRAGLPVLTDQVEEAIELARDFAPQLDGLYGLRVRGDSMRDALVNDGDIVVLQHQTMARNGDMVAVRLTDRNEFTLKRFYREPGQVRLRAANPSYPDILARPSSVEVQGRVVAVIRQF